MASSILLPAEVNPNADIGLPVSALLGRLRTSNVTPSDACAELLKTWRATGPLANAARAVAAAADQSGSANAYHNPGHTRDVAVLFATLDRLSDRIGQIPLTLEDRLAGLCSALGHDLWHDGMGNFVNRTTEDGLAIRERQPFRLETIAANATVAILEEAGASARAVMIVRAAILTTDIVDGYAALRAALAPGSIADDISYPGMTGLSDPIGLRIATMLRDADIMQSAGLTALDHDIQSEALGKELRAALNAATSEYFFSETVGGRFYSEPGRLFQARFDALRALNRLRAAEGGVRLLSRTTHELAG